jgi:microcin C transport system permease protein
MMQYIIRRLFLMLPTLLGIMVINFCIVQFAPGGPVEQAIARIKGTAIDATSRFTGGGDHFSSENTPNFDGGELMSKYRGAQGLDPELVKELEKLYGFDKPAHVRLYQMIKNYAVFDFGESFFKDRKVIDLIKDKLPVSISLGLWTTFLVYLVSIPLGIQKAIKDGSPFDMWSSVIIIVGFAIPSFLFAVLLIVLFAGGSYFDVFPLRGIVSENFSDFTVWEKIKDYLWHMTLPIASMVIGGFATLTILTKNSILEEIHKQYVITARAKGLSERAVLYKHVFRNAMLVIVAGFPTAFSAILFTGSVLIEVIFSLDGLGLLGFESALNRDYPVVFGTLYIYTLISLVLHLIGDLLYLLVDPRIDFEARKI